MKQGVSFSKQRTNGRGAKGERAIQSVRGADLRHVRNTSENSNRSGDTLLQRVPSAW